MKKLIIFAGSNGSGKSSTVKEVMDSPDFPKYFICPDNIVSQYTHIDDIKERYIKAMNVAEETRKTLLQNGDSFSFETVLSDRKNLDFIKQVKDLGYKIEIHYITILKKLKVTIFHLPKNIMNFSTIS